MTSFCRRLALVLAIVFGATDQFLVADDNSDPADLPRPITTAKPKSGDLLDELVDGPVKPAPYSWMEDDPVTPTPPSTVLSYLSDYNDLDPNFPLERPGIPPMWFANVELTAVKTDLSMNQQSEALLAAPFQVPTVPMNWNVMPKFTVGYRRPEGLGELSASYRFLFTQGSGAIGGFGGAASGASTSRLQLHVLDFDYTLSDLYPNDLLLVPRIIRLTGGIRVAGIYNTNSTIGGAITNQYASNTFVGAGPRVALESLYPVISNRWWAFGKFEGAGVLGADRQFFTQTTGGVTSSAWAPTAAIAVPVVGVKGGLQWYPEWGCGQWKFSAGYQWEEWFALGVDSTSYNNLMIQGPFVQGDFSF